RLLHAKSFRQDRHGCAIRTLDEVQVILRLLGDEAIPKGGGIFTLHKIRKQETPGRVRSHVYGPLKEGVEDVAEDPISCSEQSCALEAERDIGAVPTTARDQKPAIQDVFDATKEPIVKLGADDQACVVDGVRNVHGLSEYSISRCILSLDSGRE